MTQEIVIVLGLLGVGIYLFSREKWSVDIITLLLLLALVGLKILSPGEAFSGFSSEIIIILGSIFVLNGALQETGALEAFSRQLLKYSSKTTKGLTLTIMSTVGVISGFMNNTAATALFLSPVMAMARKAGISPSKLLMPLCYASILGGTCTLIGTSTNVAVSGFIARSGMEPLGLFELTPVGVVILAIGIVYMLSFGLRMLPSHPDEELTAHFSMREYLTELVVLPNSHLIGQKVEESDLSKMGFQIVQIWREEDHFLPEPEVVIDEGDILVVEGKIPDLMNITGKAGLDIRANVKLGDEELQKENLRLAEVLVTPRSDLVRQTLRESNFRQRFGLIVLAISRHGQMLRDRLGDVRLRIGDLLLIQGSSDRFQALQHSTDLAILEEHATPRTKGRKGWYVVGLFAAAVAAGGFGLFNLPLAIYFLSAALGVVLLKCLSIEKAYEYIDWRLLILIGGMTAFGVAMEKTGAAEFLATGIVSVMEPLGVMPIMAGFAILTILLTQPMSNAAAALVVLPIALETASQLGVNQRTFAIAIMLSASISFVAPFEPSCILVYGPGKYRFMDFVRTGAGLTIILFFVIMAMIPLFWPL